MPLSLKQIQHASAGLRRMGVAAPDVIALLDACDQDPELVLCTVELPSAPREGDRIRAKLPSGERSLLVELSAATAPRMLAGLPVVTAWAIVGRPVEASSADDALIEKVVRK